MALLKDKLLVIMKPQNHHLKTIKLIKRFHISTNIFIKFIYSKRNRTPKRNGVTDVYNLPIMGSLWQKEGKKHNHWKEQQQPNITLITLPAPRRELVHTDMSFNINNLF